MSFQLMLFKLNKFHINKNIYQDYIAKLLLNNEI